MKKTFHNFAAWIVREKSPTFVEAVLQHEFVRRLEADVWSDLVAGQLSPRNSRTADIVLRERKQGAVCLLVELKIGRELKRDHSDQAARYSEEHDAPCVLTNGFEYRVVFSRRVESTFAFEGLDGRRSDSMTSGMTLGAIDPEVFDEALEQKLRDLFIAAKDGCRSLRQFYVDLSRGTAPSRSRSLSGRSKMALLESSNVGDDVEEQDGEDDTDGEEYLEDEVIDQADFNAGSARFVASQIKKELKGHSLKVRKAALGRVTVCMGTLQIARITEFRYHCRVSVRQPDGIKSKIETTNNGWRAEPMTVRDQKSLLEVSHLLHRLWLS